MSTDDYSSTETDMSVSLILGQNDDVNTIDSLQIGECEDCFYQL